MSINNLDKDKIKNNFLETSRLLAGLAETETHKIAAAADLIAESFQRGGKLLACGNGGSAADAQHFVAEFISRHPAVALSSDPSVVTALANDYGFERVFAKQIEGLGSVGDVLVALSTSGKSPNVLAAIAAAKQKEIKVIALVGDYIDEKIKSCELVFSIPSKSTQRAQEVHMVILHAIWGALKN